MRKIFALITLPVLLGSMTEETAAKASCRIETLAGTYGAGQASCRLFFTRSADFRQLT